MYTNIEGSSQPSGKMGKVIRIINIVTGYICHDFQLLDHWVRTVGDDFYDH
jgi:hypothetical protein